MVDQKSTPLSVRPTRVKFGIAAERVIDKSLNIFVNDILRDIHELLVDNMDCSESRISFSGRAVIRKRRWVGRLDPVKFKEGG